MTTRREFLKLSLGAMAAGVVLPHVTFADEKKSPEGLPILSEKEPNAVALHYHDAGSLKEKDKALTIERSGVAFKDQHCSGCALFQGKPGEKSGPCLIFPGKAVKAGAWCQSWNKKA